ncbi:MAG: hypothetical protein GY720_20525 [bacterium]|nr:hypothetical protein [bacterium]
MSLVARHLEASGVPTVIVGSARDIVEECGVPRFVFVDFPLGNPCGKPDDVAMQRRLLASALGLLESVNVARTTVQSPEIWDADDNGWRERFMAVDDSNRAELAAAGEQRRLLQSKVKTRRPN